MSLLPPTAAGKWEHGWWGAGRRLSTMFQQRAHTAEPEDTCPDCGGHWPAELRQCERCGLTIEEVAERVAASRRRDLTDG